MNQLLIYEVTYAGIVLPHLEENDDDGFFMNEVLTNELKFLFVR